MDTKQLLQKIGFIMMFSYYFANNYASSMGSKFEKIIFPLAPIHSFKFVHYNSF